PAARPAAVAAGPNIVFVMIDTLRADALGAYNPERAGATPAIDSLARDGVLFEQAFVQASWTRPSVASVMTGRFPTAHGAVHKDDALPDAAPTLAELLRDRGWATAGIVTNYNLAPAFNYQQGFEEYVYLEPRRLFGASDVGAKLALYEILRKVHARRLTGAHDVDRYYQDARRTTDEALAWIDRHRRSGDARPFFLFVQYMDPHDPYFAHDGSGEAYGQALAPNPPREKLDRIIELYHGEVSFTDRHVGRLLDGLRDLGLYDPAIVVVWADHGVELQEHGGWWHGTTLYDEQVHVPLIVKQPAAEGAAAAARPGTRVQTWVSLIDVPWTLLRWAGHAADDLAALGYVGADLFMPRAGPVVFMEQDHQGNVLRALRYVGSDGSPYKYIEAEAIARPGLRPRELYEVAAPERSPDLRRA
ncbi:MAG: sulfatase, partial [Myxococcota bacterium]|nr:sulfatase [Myxococcota bacterium]